VLLGLDFLHRNEIIHADLHPGNILWCEGSNRIKIIDFGNAVPRDMLQIYQGHFEICAEGYRAPEILFEKGPVTTSLDIWSLGIIATEWVLTPSSPFMTNGSLIAGGAEALPLLKDFLGCGRKSGWDSCRGGRLWNSTSEVLFIHGEQDDVGSLYPYLLAMTRSSGLVSFVMKMLKISQVERSSSRSLLKDQWLVDGLLGPWADILISKDEGDPNPEVQVNWTDDDTLLNIPAKDMRIHRNLVQESFSSQSTMAYTGQSDMATSKPSAETPIKTSQPTRITVPSAMPLTLTPVDFGNSPEKEASILIGPTVDGKQVLTKTEIVSFEPELEHTVRKASQNWHRDISQYKVIALL